MMTKGRLLLTGSSGFIGSHVLPLALADGWNVIACTRSPPPAWATSEVQWLCADLRDPAQARQVAVTAAADVALHLAWNATPGQYWTAADNTDWVAGSMALARAFIQSGGRRLVAAGSCAEYAWDGTLCDERSTPLVPLTLYGVCKDAARRVMERLCADAGVDFVWSRFFFLYGPGESPSRFVGSIIDKLLRGESAACSDGGQIRDFLDVRDAAAAMMALVNGSLTGAVNVASGCPVSVREVARAAAEAAGRPDLLRLGALERRPGEPETLTAQIRRLTDEAGWKLSIPLAQGMRDTVQWRREHG